MAYFTILLGGNPEIEEIVAGGTITPGMQLALNSSGAVIAAATAGANAMKWFALEDSAQGNGIDDTYTVGQRVRVAKCHGGEKIYALLANGVGAVHIGDWIESGGSGYVREVVADASVGAVATSALLGICRIAADSTSAAVRIPIEIR
jgi:hypothetical protein